MLLALDAAHSRQYMEELRGQQVEILIEENMVIDGVEYQVGHTKEYIRAAVISDEDLTNQIDVYKRQAYISFYLEPDADQEEMLERVREGLKAVSYTHLDVYKRQGYAGADGGCAQT